MTPPQVASRWRRDWHQFRLLSRDGVRQLLDSALMARESDPMQLRQNPIEFDAAAADTLDQLKLSGALH